MAKSAQQAADNWAAAMSNGLTAEKYKQGIQNTTVNPMARAAEPEAMARYVANTALAAQGRMQRRLMSASQADWKNNALTFGARNLAAGAQKGKAKAVKAFNELAPVWQRQQQEVASMPKGGLANALARSARAIQIMMEHAGTA